MNRRPMKHHIDGLAALLLFGVFAACVLIVLLTGADAYRRLTDRDQAAYERRVCMQYVTTRVRQADGLDQIWVEDFGGEEALTLSDGGDYITRVYYHDGYVMELYSDIFSDFEPEDGERVVEAGGLSFSLEEDLLTVVAQDTAGESSTLLLSLRSGEGAGV